MADTLVQIKDKLAELAGRKEEIRLLRPAGGDIGELFRKSRINKKYIRRKRKFRHRCHKNLSHGNGYKPVKGKELAVCQKEKEYAEKHIREISRKLIRLKSRKVRNI